MVKAGAVFLPEGSSSKLPCKDQTDFGVHATGQEPKTDDLH